MGCRSPFSRQPLTTSAALYSGESGEWWRCELSPLVDSFSSAMRVPPFHSPLPPSSLHLHTSTTQADLPSFTRPASPFFSPVPDSHIPFTTSDIPCHLPESRSPTPTPPLRWWWWRWSAVPLPLPSDHFSTPSSSLRLRRPPHRLPYHHDHHHDRIGAILGTSSRLARHCVVRCG